MIRLEEAARLHDVGEWLLDWEQLRARTQADPFGATLAPPAPDDRPADAPHGGLDVEACRIAGAHHERLDGTGYPERLVGHRVPLGAQVLSVAEQFEAMTQARPHRPAMDTDVALAILREALPGASIREAVKKQQGGSPRSGDEVPR